MAGKSALTAMLTPCNAWCSMFICRPNRIRLSILGFTAAVIVGWMPNIALAQNPCNAPIHLGNIVAPGLGGTGHEGDALTEPGMGGTGHSTEPGLGGTGQIAQKTNANSDSFVYGVITGFASICVNGIEVHYTDATPVTAFGQSSSTQQLKVGQWVAVQARTMGNSKPGFAAANLEMQAQHIEVQYAAIGPITRISPNGKPLEVMGKPIDALPNLPNGTWKLGEPVAVSGVNKPNGRILATHLAPLSTQFIQKPQQLLPLSIMQPGSQVHIQGYLPTQNIHQNTIELQGVRIRLNQELQNTLKKQFAKTDDVLTVMRGKLGRDGVVDAHAADWVQEHRILQRGGNPQQRSAEDSKSKKQKDSDSEKNEHEERSSNDDHHASDNNRTDRNSARDAARDAAKQIEEQQKLLEKALEYTSEKTNSSNAIVVPSSNERINSDKTQGLNTRSEKTERPEKVEKPEKKERIEKIDRPEKVERTEKPERVERVERSERTERPNKPERSGKN